MSVNLDDDWVVAALPAYEIGEELGRGAWGVVRAGRHRQLDRDVAIKQLPPIAAADPAVRERFVAEARVLAGLDHHHIVPVYDFVEREGLCLLIMERLTGGTLWDRFVAGELGIQASCAAVLATCAGLHHAHQRGTLHRDIKPANLMFSAEGVLKVTDFGMAKVVGGSITLASPEGQVLGTPAYMAPEQASGRRLGPGTDIYAAATVLYELLSGRLPFPKDSKPLATLHRHVHEQPLPLRDIAPWVPDPVANVTMIALSTDPADRYESAEAFGVALAGAACEVWGVGWLSEAGLVVSSSSIVSAASGEHVALDPPPALPSPSRDQRDGTPAGLVPVSSFSERGGRPGRRRRLIAGLLAPVAVAAVVGGVLLTRSGGQPSRPQVAPAAPPAAADGSAPVDPAVVSQWRALRDAPVARQQVAVAVADGTVWVFGGLEGDRATAKAEGYDPAIDTWKTGPDLPVPLHHAMAVTYQGELVVIGGWIPNGPDLTARTSNRVFVLRDGEWQELERLNQPRAAGAAAVVGDRIVVTGGQSDGALISATEVFDGTRWTDADPIPTPREHLAAASDGRYVYAVGGRDLSADNNVAALERYDASADRWETLTGMPTPRGGLGASVVKGRLVTVGGEEPTDVYGTVESYDLDTGVWTSLPSLGTPRHGLGVAAVGGSLYAINGATRPTHAESSDTVEVLTVQSAAAQASTEWRTLTSSFTARQQVAVAPSGGILWVLGGLEAQHATPRTEGYDPLTDRWQPGVDLPLPLHHAMAVSYQGQLIVMGGWIPEGSALNAVTSDRVFTLRGGVWKELPNMRRPRAAGAAAVVGNKIVVFGGQNDGRLVTATEVFDGTRWTDADPIPTPREHLAGASDGRYVYAVGGRDLSADNNFSALDRYDPVTGTWETLKRMPTPRGGLAAAIAAGWLITAGGENPTGVFETVEAYNLETGAWSTLAPLRIPRHGLGLAAIGTQLYALNGATRPTHAESSAAVETLTLPPTTD
ncbi:MAG: Kelch repeat-containing protein [Egibacteraceae bacterium]